MTEPRWRRWSEHPAVGQKVVVLWPGATGPDGDDEPYDGDAETWDDVDHPEKMFWMPVSEWRDVLARIPEPDNPDEWIVDNGESVKKRGHYVSDRTLVYAEPDYVVAALNAYEEGR